MAKGSRYNEHFTLVGPSRKGVVAINTTPEEVLRKDSLQRWLKRTQEVLAHRSLQGHSFHRLYNLMRTKRLVELALDRVLRNDGAKTAGVDGKTKRHLKTETSRAQFIDALWRDLTAKTYRPAPVRRVYIPKANGEQRPLGIPTLRDRVVQEMLRLILEPIYEAKFHRHSYGFRPFRSTHHAALRLHRLIGKSKHHIVIEGDISKCFDRIHHHKLLGILRRTIKDERIIKMIKEMLTAGVMEDDAWHVTDEGTPQGGIVSPLLANIYLNELDQFIAAKWENLPTVVQNRHYYNKSALPCFIVRYADDFVITLRGTIEQAEQLKAEVADFLRQELHLELSGTKTLITPVEDGFDFLGFHIRKYQRVTLITPSQKAVAKFKSQVKTIVKTVMAADEIAGMAQLNRYLIGWGMHYRRVSSYRVFKTLDHYVWKRVWTTAYRLHRNQRLTPGQHYRKFCIPYRYDLRQVNRERNGSNYGVWADEAHKHAHIVIKLTFFPIRYVELFPSKLNPYVPEDRLELLRKQERQRLLTAMQSDDYWHHGPYGTEWRTLRGTALAQASNRCERCGAPIQGRNATVHHKRPLKQVKPRKQMNTLENLSALCPTCHVQAEREGQ